MYMYLYAYLSLHVAQIYVYIICMQIIRANKSFDVLSDRIPLGRNKYMYICMHISIYVYIYMYIYTYTYVCVCDVNSIMQTYRCLYKRVLNMLYVLITMLLYLHSIFVVIKSPLRLLLFTFLKKS